MPKVPKLQTLTLPVLRNELSRNNNILKEELRQEIKASGDSIKKDLRQEIKANGDSIKQELKQEIKTSGDELRSKIKFSENRILERLGTVYEDFESKQAIMAEGIATLNDKVTIVQIDMTSMGEKLDSLSGRVFFLEQKINPASR